MSDTKPKFKPYVVRFSEWTVYALKVQAESEEHAIELAQAGIESGELLNDAIAKDGSQDDWCAFPDFGEQGGAS